MWCYRRLLRIPWTQHKMNEWILCKLKVDRELLDRVKSLKLGFYGHKTRKYESLEKEMVEGCVPGYRNRGHQCRRWTDDITEWTGMKIKKQQQQQKIATVGEWFYAPPTLLMEEGTERRQQSTLLKTFVFAETQRLVTFCLSAPCISTLTYLQTDKQTMSRQTSQCRRWDHTSCRHPSWMNHLIASTSPPAACCNVTWHTDTDSVTAWCYANKQKRFLHIATFQTV